MTLLECQRDASPHPRLQLPLEGSLDTLAAYAGDTARYIDRRPWIESAYGRIRAWPPILQSAIELLMFATDLSNR